MAEAGGERVTDVERVNVTALDRDEVAHIRARLDVLLAAFDDLRGVDVDGRNEPRDDSERRSLGPNATFSGPRHVEYATRRARDGSG